MSHDLPILKMLEILRNPQGATKEEKEVARLMAAGMVEEFLRKREIQRVRQQAGMG